MKRPSGEYVRGPAVAGQFYRSDPAGLSSEVGRYIVKDAPKEKAIGIISPHAGLMYSGHVAGAVYSSIEMPETFVLLGPNHRGLGPDVSIMRSGKWEMPTGVFEIDEDLGSRIIQKAPGLTEDINAHMFEHSIEVQLPFISYLSDRVKIVPISVMQASLSECEELGRQIAEAVKEVDHSVVIAASSDMSHYVSDEAARQLDSLAVREILNMNPGGLYETVLDRGITMCGFIPATIMLFASKFLGAKEARLVKYATSGEISGDYLHVVGYAGLIIR